MNWIEWFSAGFVTALIVLVLMAMFAAKYALSHPQMVVKMFIRRGSSGTTRQTIN